jgi:hypothetical protein
VCIKCDNFDKAIAKYRWLKGQFEDDGVRKAADRLIAELEADKVDLHPAR